MIYSEGATGFTPLLCFGADRMYYMVYYTRVSDSARAPVYPILAHITVEHDFRRSWEHKTGAKSFTLPDGTFVFADYYRYYLESAPEIAELLRAGGTGESLARRTLRVWYNGEAVDGICMYTALHGWYGFSTFTLLYDRIYDEEDVTRVRIELKLPEDYE